MDVSNPKGWEKIMGIGLTRDEYEAECEAYEKRIEEAANVYAKNMEKLEKRIEELEAENKRLLDQLERTQGYEAGFIENLRELENDNDKLASELRDWKYLGASWHKRHGKYYDVDLDRLMRKARKGK